MMVQSSRGEARGVGGGADQALRYALRLLARRDYCEAEMRSRLISRGFAGPCIRHTLDRLVELGFLSDERFARSFIRSRVRRGETPWLAAAKARQKGVREDALNAALAASLEEYDKVAACRNLLAKRDPQSLRLVDSKIRRRQIRYLKSKGFDTATIFHVMNEDEG